MSSVVDLEVIMKASNIRTLKFGNTKSPPEEDKNECPYQRLECGSVAWALLQPFDANFMKSVNDLVDELEDDSSDDPGAFELI